jgi:hypothetical protein
VTGLTESRRGSSGVCAEQGFLVKLSDPIALRRVADILGEARGARDQKARRSSQAR